MMRVIETLAPSILLALLVFLIHRIVRRSSPASASHKSSLAPIHRLSKPEAEAGWNVDRKGFTLSVWTSGLNHVAGKVVHRRGGAKATRTAGLLKLMYNAGILAGVGGLVLATGGLVWSAGAVWVEVWREAELHARLKSEVAHVVGRALREVDGDGSEMPITTKASSPGLQPLIPGITIPLTHLPTLLLAFLVNQLLHEAGHALSGAIDDVQMSRFSFNLHLLFPSATVTFPSSVDSLSSRAKLRLATSGPMHNLLTYLVLLLLSLSGLPRLFWADRSAQGVIVYSVAPSSPLYGHVNPGDLISHVDDVFLGEQEGLWEKYMSGILVGDEGKGWCVDRTVYMSLQTPPCAGYSGTVPFEPVDLLTSGLPPRGQVKCLQTHPVLQIPSATCPCPSNKWVCVHPQPEEEIIRIRLGGQKDEQGNERVVLFSGDRREVLEGVRVGGKGARIFGEFVRWESMFLEYLSVVALSLYLFNLLPLPHTDGSAVLRSLLAAIRYSPSRSLSTGPGAPTFHATLSNAISTPGPGASDSPYLPSGPFGSPFQAKTPSINLSRQYELNSDDEDDYDEERHAGGRGGGRGSSWDRSSGGGGGAAGGGGGRGGRDGKKEEAWKRRLRRGVEGSVMAVGAVWLAGWAMLSLLKSS